MLRPAEVQDFPEKILVNRIFEILKEGEDPMLDDLSPQERINSVLSYLKYSYLLTNEQADMLP
jgi:hypothetical protein